MEELEDKVTLVHFTQEPSRLIVPDHLKGQECPFCKETKDLLKEVSALSRKIELTTYDFLADKEKSQEYEVEKIPATIVVGKEDYGIRFFGIPPGYEYTSFIEAIIDASKRKTKLDQKTIDTLNTVRRNVHIQVFVTPTCPYCTMVVRIAHQFALQSSSIKEDMIESTEFPHLVQKYNIRGVPKAVINETVPIEGSMPEETFLEHVLKAANLKEEKEDSPPA